MPRQSAENSKKINLYGMTLCVSSLKFFHSKEKSISARMSSTNSELANKLPSRVEEQFPQKKKSEKIKFIKKFIVTILKNKNATQDLIIELNHKNENLLQFIENLFKLKILSKFEYLAVFSSAIRLLSDVSSYDKRFYKALFKYCKNADNHGLERAIALENEYRHSNKKGKQNCVLNFIQRGRIEEVDHKPGFFSCFRKGASDKNKPGSLAWTLVDEIYNVKPNVIPASSLRKR